MPPQAPRYDENMGNDNDADDDAGDDGGDCGVGDDADDTDDDHDHHGGNHDENTVDDDADEHDEDGDKECLNVNVQVCASVCLWRTTPSFSSFACLLVSSVSYFFRCFPIACSTRHSS